MNYSDFRKYIEEFTSDYSLEVCLHAYRVTEHYGDLIDLNEENKSYLYELMASWWFKDDGIGYEIHAKTWSEMLKNGMSIDSCWDIKWDISEV